MTKETIRVNVVYAKAGRQTSVPVELAPGGTVQQAIDQSGLLKQYPEIDLARQKVGVFSKVVALDATVEDGARIEIYRPITVDPSTVRRRTVTKPA